MPGWCKYNGRIFYLCSGDALHGTGIKLNCLWQPNLGSAEKIKKSRNIPLK